MSIDNKNQSKNDYNPSEIEAKWQEMWEKEGVYSPDIKEAKKPFFNLMMFPYPSAEGLHVGNMYAFTGADVYGRYQRMKGNDVLEPIGLDGFGIHSENYAMKVGRHPKGQAQIAESNFYRQLKSIGNSFDWSRTIETYDPNYYKWTQWLFIQLFKNGLAYRKKATVNWCPQDQTVLSDEQVIAGECERCGSKVEKRDLEQWFFKITDYAERLLQNIDKLNWTEKVKIAQRNWIGKSEGAEVEFEVEGSDVVLKVFTTRPDTLYGVTFMVIAPEHELSVQISQSKFPNANNIDVKNYIEEAKKKTEIERTAEGKDKTGVDTGLFAINPLNSKKIPIFVADYVLSGYGTGAIMAVPAHDQRDFEFANKYNLPIVQVIKEKGASDENQNITQAYEAKGEIIGSEEWNGFHMPDEMNKILNSLEEKKIGVRKIQFHLRDWLISRQRYWGPPIPMIFCESCAQVGKGEREDMPGWYSVSNSELPILLPDVKDWKPMGTGKAPLANHPEFYEVLCPSCGSKATRETDVSDTFLDSSWYFLRYPSIDIQSEPFDSEVTRKWLPVTMYIGGAEHSVLHLLYSRFITMALFDMKYLSFDEPFSRFFAHGLIIKDGAKMSKSKGNVVVPDSYISKFGADTLRSYLMFLGPFSDGGDFRDSGIEGMHRFIRKVWRLISEKEEVEVNELEAKRFMHQTIKKVTKDIEELAYNTAIASLMEWYNFLNIQKALTREEKETFLKLIAPFAPHMTEELWYKMGHSSSIHISSWPSYQESFLEREYVDIVLQINGKKRAVLEVKTLEIKDKENIENKAKDKLSSYLNGKDIIKSIYIEGKILNIVI